MCAGAGAAQPVEGEAAVAAAAAAAAPPEGVDALRAALLAMVPAQPRPDDAARPLLFAVDHCFPIKGQGTVLTGTVLQAR